MNAPSGEKKGESAFERVAAARRRAGFGRRRWASLAGSIMAGVLVGVLLWQGGSTDPLRRDVLEHLRAEPGALAAAARPADPGPVLARAGIGLDAAAGEVTYAATCQFRGRPVPHLVVQGEGGPVTLLVLRHERVEAPLDFTARGFSGRIVPSGPGSLVVAAEAGTDLEPLVPRMQAAIEWLQ
jgi:hypothetical protein